MPPPRPDDVYLHHFSFNQDQSCFVASTTRDFRTFTVNPLAEVARRSPKGDGAPVRMVAMLFKTNLFAVVLEESPHTVLIWNDEANRAVGELRSRYEVKGLALRRDVVAVVSEYRVILYSAAKFSVVRQLETCSNPQGTFALAPISPAWVLAFPALPSGTLRIQSAEFPEAVSVAAHQSALALLSTDSAGTVVASASEAGTVVKVWQSRDGTLLHELRRGVHPTQISCMTFRDDARYLAVASASPTVHVFKLDGSKDGEKDADLDDPYSRASLSGFAGSAISAITANAPEVINGAVTTVVKSMQASRSGAVFRIPDVDAVGKPSVDLRHPSPAGSALVGPQVAFGSGDAQNHIFVLCYSGFLYEAQFEEAQFEAEEFHSCLLATPPTTWFGTRRDFHMHTEQPAPTEGDDWQLL
jgi:hypothetical protein